MNLTLSHVQVFFLPSNTTSVIQPLDAGMFAALIGCYRCLQAGCTLELDDIESDNIYEVDVVQSICWIVFEWTTFSLELIADYWRRTSLNSVTGTEMDEMEEKSEEERQALTLEVAEVVSEKTNRMSIATSLLSYIRVQYCRKKFGAQSFKKCLVCEGGASRRSQCFKE